MGRALRGPHDDQRQPELLVQHQLHLAGRELLRSASTRRFRFQTTGTRLIDDNVLFMVTAPVGFESDFTITNNYFDDSIQAIGGTRYSKEFSGNFIRRDDFSIYEGILGDVTGNFFLAVPAAGNDNMFLTGGMFQTNILNNVFQYIGTGSGGGGDFVRETEGNNTDPVQGNLDSSAYIVVEGNLVLPPQGGVGVPRFRGDRSSNLDPSLPTNYSIYEHNTIITYQDVSIAANTNIGTRSGAILSLQDNLFYNMGTTRPRQPMPLTIRTGPTLPSST